MNKLSELTTNPALTTDDLIYVVDDAAGVPASYKSTIAAVLGLIPDASASVSGLINTTTQTIAGAKTFTGNFTLQNSTTAIIAEISKTYTSATDREYLGLGYNSGLTGYFVGSRVGSAGGTNRDLKIGHLAANGTTFVGMNIATTGLVTIGHLSIDSTIYFSSAGYVRMADYAKIISGGNWGLVDIAPMTGNQAGVIRLYNTLHSLTNYERIEVGQGVAGDAFVRTAAGGTGTRRNLTLDAPVLTASGTLIHIPPNSITLATNGQFTIEMTSNTAGNLVYRGSDGTTRRAALTFS